jgi:hypothetical protein
MEKRSLIHVSGQPLGSVLAVIKLSIPTLPGSECGVSVGTCASANNISRALSRNEKGSDVEKQDLCRGVVVVFEDCAARNGRCVCFRVR